MQFKMLQEFGDQNLNNGFYADWMRIDWKRASRVLPGVIEICCISSIATCCVLNAGGTRKRKLLSCFPRSPTN